MTKVLVAVPTFDSIEPDTFKSIYGLEIPLGISVKFDFVRGYDVSRARNLIAKETLQYQFDYVLMVDSDIILPSWALARLLEAGKDVILGWYPRRKSTDGKTELFSLGKKDFLDDNNINISEINGTEPVEIKGGGLGCGFIKASLFPALGKNTWFKYVEYDDGAVLSEDNYFCSTATKAGFKVWFHPQVRCGHISKVVL